MDMKTMTATATRTEYSQIWRRELQGNDQKQQPPEQQQQQAEAEDTEEWQSSSTATCYGNGTSSFTPIRIVTSSHVAPTLQIYVDRFNQLNNNNNNNGGNKEVESPPPIRLTIRSSFRDLNFEAKFDTREQSGLYDGYVIPPMMIGDIYEYHGLVSMDDRFRSTTFWDDLLPYYKNHVATYDGHIRSVPLLSGNQMLLLFRKDYLDALNMPTPKTWSEFTRVAATLHNQPLGVDGEPIYGVCLGRMSDNACQKQTDMTTEPCSSLSATYIGMILASMTQSLGNSTGWLFDDDTSKGMRPLLNGTLERVLLSMEEILQYGAPDELLLDSSINIEYFEAGRCAMTITADHPKELLQDENVGFVPLPGSNQVYDRDSSSGGGGFTYCTKENCPYSTFRFNNFLGLVNRVPFGAQDMVVGGVSTSASEDNRDVVMDFFEFVATTKLNVSVREQPMTYSELQSSSVDGYLEVMEELTTDENVAIPFRVPGAFSLLSELDNSVYEYLLGGNYTETNRINVRRRIEASWGRQIRKHDNQFGVLPTSIFYEKSLGSFVPESSTDLYIGTVARYTGWSLGALCCFFSLYCAFWVWKNQDRRVVRASQPMFLYLVCLGTFVMAATVFPVGIEDDIAPKNVVDIACITTLWFYSLGFVLIFCALFSKIWRVTQIFRSSTMKQQRIIVGTKDVLLPFSLLFGINFVVLMIWTITDPVAWYRYPIEEPATEFGLVEESTYGTCDSENYRLFLGIIVGVNLFVSLAAVIQAYECRRVSTEYSEILWISSAFCIVVQVWLIGLPVLKLLGDDPFWSFISKTVIVFITSMLTLLCIFVPKMRFLRETNKGRMKGGYDETTKLSMANHRVSDPHHEHTDGTNEQDDTQFNGDDSARDSARRRHHNFDESTLRHSDDPVRVGLAPPSSVNPPKPLVSGMVGIRIINSLTGDGDELERLKSKMKKAEKRNRVLQDRLERLQDQLEHYLVAHSNRDDSMPSRIRPEQARVSSSEGSHSMSKG